MTMSHRGVTRYVSIEHSYRVYLIVGLQIEFCLVDLNPETERATLLLDQGKVMRQWEKDTASKKEP